MSWLCQLYRRSNSECAYGLHPDNPVLCGGGVAAELDYLQRLRCPAGKPIRFERQGSVKRTRLDYLKRSGVQLKVSRGMRRRMGEAAPGELPLDAFLIACECGRHHGQIIIDMDFRGPEAAIGAAGWTLADGASPADSISASVSCPYCGEELRTSEAKQCRFCMMDWHDPNNVFRRNRGTKNR